MREDLTREAVVIDRVQRASGNIGRVGVAMPFRRDRACIVIAIALRNAVLMRHRM
jgi:hypothetical protein